MSTTCNTVPSMTLQSAVLDQVVQFANVSRMFSIHDVTTAIRRRVSQGEIEIPETEVHGASFRNDIPHSKVKELFNDLFATGTFDPVCTLNRKFNGTYFEFTPTLVASTTPAPTNVAATTTANVATVTPVTASPAVITGAAPMSDDAVKARIRTYLNNCVTRNFRPTLKQVQSAIKRTNSTGWTCSRIADYIEQDLGYTIVADPDFISASQVVI